MSNSTFRGVSTRSNLRSLTKKRVYSLEREAFLPNRTALLLCQLKEIVGPDHFETNQEKLQTITNNSLGVYRAVVGLLRPGSVLEVKQVLLAAHAANQPVYPISRGRNIGYGERAPVENGQLILDLSRLNRIRDYDATHGSVVVEPGVTQKQLYEFLLSKNAPFWMDTTGAPLDSSLVGNTLEGGFGHSPRGNRRKELTNLGARVAVGGYSRVLVQN